MTRAREYFLAIDQGGHASRAIVFDERGHGLARGFRETRERRPRPGWVEQDAEEILGSVAGAVEDVRADLGTARPTRAALATQRSSVVCWDRVSGKALSPVISWQDRRAGPGVSRLRRRAEAVREKTGLFLSPHYGGGKLRWCLENLADVSDAMERGRLACGPLASFLSFRLAGRRAAEADPANASRTLLWNIRTLDWDPDLLGLFRVPREALPRSVATRHGFGRIPWGEARLPLEVVTGDQSAALYGHGRPDPSTAYLNLGTGAFVQRIVEGGPRLTGGLLASVVLSDAGRVVYSVEGTVNGAGSALAQVSKRLRIPALGDDLAAWLDRPCEPPLFLNGVSGLGSPFWVPRLRSRFVGSGEPWQRLVAVVESIVFLVRVNLRCMEADGPGLRRIVASGGLARLDGLCRRLADLTGLEVQRPAEPEATARGAACVLAGLPGWRMSGPVGRFLPREDPALARRFRRWEEALRAALPASARARG